MMDDSAWDHPRIRGEHVRRPQGGDRSGRIIPAYAGSTLRPDPEAREVADHPRIRGEHRGSGYGAVERPGSSPHTRGAPEISAHRPHAARIIPAYAGSTVWSGAPGHLSADHPRIRGEHEHLPAPGQPAVGSSPHTRGAPVGVSRGTARAGIIPAYAGSTSTGSCRHSRKPDHPRIRGEHKDRGSRVAFFEGSSPHTRGARGDDLLTD